MADIAQRTRLRWTKRRERLALLQAAREYIRRGWPVIPGAWWSQELGRHICDIPSCLSGGLHPAALDTGPVPAFSPPPNLADFALAGEDDARAQWRERPYSVLMPTGISCDVIEMAAASAARIWPNGSLTSLHCPTAQLAPRSTIDTGPLTQDPTVFIVTQRGESISSDTINELTRHHVVLHREGSWIPLPPSSVSGGSMRWVVSPQQCDWQTLPLAQLTQHILRRLVQLRSAPIPLDELGDSAA